MNRKYSKQKSNRCVDKSIEFRRVIDSVNIDNKDYREIFDDAIQYAYGEPLNEYSEKNINTIMVNNIRHNCSNYDSMIKCMRKVRRSEDDYLQYKNSVLEKIANNYPFLKDECIKQKRKFDMVKVFKQR